MAEEKKDTTKKTTTKKKEPIEEVKVEKRFCTKCGKELKDGEVCACSSENENASANPAVVVNGDAIVNTGKDIWSTILNVFKKPATTVSEEANSSRSNKSIILTVILAIAFAFYLVAALIVAKIAKNNNFTFKKSFNLYITSNAPMVFAYLGMAIILLLNVSLLTVLGTIATLIISVFCFFNFIVGFNSETKIKEDRRSYAITGLISLWIVMAVVAFIIISLTFASGMVKEITNHSSNDYSDIFNW